MKFLICCDTIHTCDFGLTSCTASHPASPFSQEWDKDSNCLEALTVFKPCIAVEWNILWLLPNVEKLDNTNWLSRFIEWSHSCQQQYKDYRGALSLPSDLCFSLIKFVNLICGTVARGSFMAASHTILLCSYRLSWSAMYICT